jgi:signal peptidase I
MAQSGVFLADRREQRLSGIDLIELIQAVLRTGSSVRIQANGCSMSPFIRNGDVLMLSALRAKSPGLGDVVAFRFSGTNKLTFHRVAGKVKGLYLVRGDNCPEADGLIPESDILGTVNGIERDGSPVFFGLGPERQIIAFLSGRNILFLLKNLLRKIPGFFKASSGRGVLAPTTM